MFDSGCIGEGVLHILAAAQAKLLTPHAALVPLSARVWCQPIQLRVGQVLGFDCSQANRWRWRPDYEGMELGRCRWGGGTGGPKVTDNPRSLHVLHAWAHLLQHTLAAATAQCLLLHGLNACN